MLLKVLDIIDNGVLFEKLNYWYIRVIIEFNFSSLSTSLNTLSGTLLDDFIRPLSPKKINDSLANIILKMTVVILGIVAGALVFLVEKMGTIMQVRKENKLN